MKKKTLVIIISVFLGLLVIAGAVFAILHFKKAAREEEEQRIEKERIENTRAFIEEEVKKDWAAKSDIKTNTDSDADQQVPVFVSSISRQSAFEVISYEEDGENYIATVRVTGPDMGSLLEKVSEEDLGASDAGMDKFLDDKLAEAEKKSIETTVRLQKNEDGYTVIYSPEFVDAMSGYLYFYVSDAFEGATEGGRAK